MPTCLDLAKSVYPKNLGNRTLLPIEGKSLLPVFHGETQATRTLAWEHEGNRGLRVGDLKLVGSYLKPWEMYDLKTDRSECHDLSKAQPERCASW